MKKVGIISMHRVINYGSVLQAYALKQMLEAAGADTVDFIDIRPGQPLAGFESKNLLSRILGRKPFSAPINFIKDLLFSRRYHRSVLNGWAWLGIDKPAVSEEDVDLVVIGSDEVFNCCQPTPWGLSSQLYGDIRGRARVVSYGGSFGNTKLTDLERLKISEKVGTWMKRMDAMSVRDENSEQIVRQITGCSPERHIDPVLAYGYTSEIEEMDVPPMTGRYMVVYSYHGRISAPQEIIAIQNFARERGLKIVSVMCRYDWCTETANPKNPLDVLRWFKFAEYAVVDTFHGTIFSVITGCRFATLIRPSNRNKLSSLLSDCGLSNHELSNPERISQVLELPMSLDDISRRLEPLRKSAQEYLKSQVCSI